MILSARLAEHYHPDQLENIIIEVMNSWTDSIELSVGIDAYQHLIVLPRAEELGYLQEEPLKLIDLLQALERSEERPKLILDLTERNLEWHMQAVLRKIDYPEKIYLTGLLDPSLFTKWERRRIFYQIDNCIPMCDELKEAHFDVVSYYCRQYGMQTVRITADQFQESFVQKVQDLNLKLSVGDLNSWEEFVILKSFDQMITQLSISASKILTLPVSLNI